MIAHRAKAPKSAQMMLPMPPVVEDAMVFISELTACDGKPERCAGSRRSRRYPRVCCPKIECDSHRRYLKLSGIALDGKKYGVGDLHCRQNAISNLIAFCRELIMALRAVSVVPIRILRSLQSQKNRRSDIYAPSKSYHYILVKKEFENSEENVLERKLRP